jgi:hypothetical protein
MYQYDNYNLLEPVPLKTRSLESDSFCTCKQIESSDHFLLTCPIYPRLRNNLFINLSGPKNSYNLLLWNPNISDNKNCNNFVIVQDFIIKSKRFVQVLLKSWWWRLVAFALYNICDTVPDEGSSRIASCELNMISRRRYKMGKTQRQ